MYVCMYVCIMNRVELTKLTFVIVVVAVVVVVVVVVVYGNSNDCAFICIAEVHNYTM